jgi:hypothetical protein
MTGILNMMRATRVKKEKMRLSKTREEEERLMRRALSP